MNNKKILIVIGIMFSACAGWCNDWTMQRHDAQNTAKTDEVAYPPLTHQWSYETFSPITASPIVARDAVFVGNHIGAFYALRAFGGEDEVLWQFDGQGMIDSTACYYNGAVYFGTRDGYLYALDSDDGSLIWSQNLGTTIIGSPIIADGILYIGKGAPSGDVAAYNAVTGQLLGTFTTTQPVQCSPAVYAGFCYITSNDGALYRFDAGTFGQSYKHQTIGSFLLSSPLITGNGVFIAPANDERKMYRISLNAASAADESAMLTDLSVSNRTSSPAYHNGTIYVSMCGELVDFVNLHFKLFVLDSADLSNELWSYDFGVIENDQSISNPTLTQNCVYATTFDGKLMAFKQSDGTVLYDNTLSVNSIESQAVVSNGWVFVCLHEGTIKAYKADTIVSLVSPRAYDVINATTAIKGTVMHDDLSQFTVSYGVGLNPDTWTTIATKTGPVDNASIIEWYPSAALDGAYTMKIEAVTSPASSLNLASIAPFTVNLPPQQPTGLSLAEGSGSYTLSWTLSADDGAGDNDVTMYRIYRSTHSGSYGSHLDSVPAGTLSYTDTTIISETQYYYIVRAYDGLQESSSSNEVQNTVLTHTEWEEISTAAGGEVALPEGTGVTFLPGTFSEPVFVRIAVKHAGEYTDPGDTLLMRGTNIVREFSVLTAAQLNALSGLSEEEQSAQIQAYTSSMIFNKQATIRLAYTVSAVAGLDPGKLSIAVWDAAASQWARNNTSSVNTNLQYVEAQITHFSLYRIAENPWVRIPSAAGGAGSLLDGTQAILPQNTCTEDVWVSIASLGSDEINTTGLGREYRSSGIARRFYVITDENMDGINAITAADLKTTIKSYSSAVSFSSLVTIRIPYSDEAIAGLSPARLRIMWFDETENAWKIVNTSTVNTEQKYAQAQVSHFSDYQIAEFMPYGDLLEKDKVYTYPNPATGDTLTFKYFSGDDCFVFIDVFNVAGEKVAHLAGEGQAGLVSTIEWDIKRYASGIYMYIIEAKQKEGNSKKKIVKKLAIIH